MSASETQIKGGANLPLILLQTHDSLRYALNTINICHLSRFVKKHTSISGAIDGRRNLKLLLEEFDKMRSIRESTLHAYLRYGFKRRDQQQARLHESLMDKPTMWWYIEVAFKYFVYG